jgi:subtilisin family serine protease
MKDTKGKCIFKLVMLLLAIYSLKSAAFGQSPKRIGWHYRDLKKDGVMGISADAAYGELLQGRTGIPVVVAVIDGGVDTAHAELSPVLWRNKGEIPHNGKVDDVNGWNFMGDLKGSFQQDNYDLVRQLRQAKGDAMETRKLEGTINNSRWNVALQLEETKLTLEALDRIVADLGKPNPTLSELKDYRYRDEAGEQQLIKIVAALSGQPDLPSYRKHLLSRLESYSNDLNYGLNMRYDPRKGKAFRDPFSGNGDVQGSWAVHGSHVAGIITGKTVGVARENVKLMILRTVPSGDYLDGEMARAIRYAADNGAKVINISAGKSGSTDTKLIESAIRHAMDKDVLIVHAAGNDGKQLEQGYYPRRAYQDGTQAKAWLEVGASGPASDSSVVLYASNYGKAVVDVFAPGAKIRSCSPGNGYSEQSGTSMAAPVVAGITAVLRSYYPGLTAEKIMEIILASVQPVAQLVRAPSGKMLKMNDLCASGGIANLYRALEMAEKLKQ